MGDACKRGMIECNAGSTALLTFVTADISRYENDSKVMKIAQKRHMSHKWLMHPYHTHMNNMMLYIEMWGHAVHSQTLKHR